MKREEGRGPSQFDTLEEKVVCCLLTVQFVVFNAEHRSCF